MKVSPILFSGPMIRALLEGRKTQTRRILKPQPRVASWQHVQRMHGTSPDGHKFGDWREFRVVGPDYPDSEEDSLWCPFGQPGDLLWCRETWQLHTRAVDLGKVVYRASERASHTEFHRLIPANLMGDLQPKPFQEGWRSPLHMPRWASRLTLELAGVRSERLQEIGDCDIAAEGVETAIGYLDYTDTIEQAHENWRELWESINGEESWASNPWVWVLEFCVHQQNIDAFLEQRRAA